MNLRFRIDILILVNIKIKLIFKDMKNHFLLSWLSNFKLIILNLRKKFSCQKSVAEFRILKKYILWMVKMIENAKTFQLRFVWSFFCLTFMTAGNLQLFGNLAYVVNKDNSSLAVLNVENNSIIKTIEKNINNPTAIAITPNKKYAYITNAGNNSICVIDIENDNQAIQSLTKDVNCPYAIAITPNGKYAYVASMGNDSINVIDIENDNRLLQRITKNILRPYAIAITPNGKYAYVANLGNSSISVVDLENGNMVIQCITKNISIPYAIAITPNGKYAYVVNGGDNSICVIDIENDNTVIQSITKDITNPYAIAITPNGKYVYVGNYSGSISIIDVEKQNEVVQVLTKGFDRPYAIAITPDGKYAYIANLGDGSIYIVSIEKNNQITDSVKGFNAPYGIAFAAMPLSQASPIDTKYNSENLFQKDTSICHLYDEMSLIDERASLVKYLTEFPSDVYKLYFSNDTGYFFIDNINDPIKNILKQGMIWEPHVHQQVKKYALPGTTVLDVGAHIGTETIVMANCVGKSGKVHTFEPQKKNFRELWANCLINKLGDRVQLYHMAIGGAHMKVEIGEIVANSDGEVDEGGIGIWGGGDITEMRTIDSFRFNNVSLIKIDVEGCEDEVLDGMVETLKNNKPVIIIEIMGGWVWETAPPDIKTRILNTQKKLVNLGYEVQHINSWDYIAFPKLQSLK